MQGGSTWQKRGWCEDAQFCQFEHLRTGIGKTEGGGWLTRVESPGFANSSTHILGLANLGSSRWLGRTKDGGWLEKDRDARFCKFEHLCA